MDINQLKANVFPGESGGDYNALFGYSNRPNGQFEGVNLTDMTVDEALQFASPSGPYAQWVKGQVGRVATPMGAYQVVGTTLRSAKEGLGLTGNERMTPDLQDQIGQWIYQAQGPGAWEAWGKGGSGGNMQRPTGLLGTPTVSTQGQMPEQPQEKLPFFQRPGVGNFFDTLAMGLEGMTLNPNQALIQGAQSRIASRREQAQQQQQTNRTLDYLSQLGTPQAADALRYIEATGDVSGGLKIARETVEPGYQVFTGAQLNEQYGTTLDPSGLFNVSGKGQVTKVGGGDINLTMPGSDKMADTIAKAVPDILTAGAQAKRGLLELQELSRLLETAPQGLQGGFVKLAGDFGLSFEGTDEVQAATAIINRLVPQQRQPGSGPMSDADLELFKQSLPRIINQPGGNQLIIDTIRRIMEYDIRRADIVEQGLRANKGPQEIMVEIYALENPIPVDFRQQAAAPSSGDELDPDAAADLLLGN